MADDVVRMLPPPADRTLHLIGDTTLERKRGHTHPLGHKARFNGYQGFTFGFEVVVMLASWDHLRIPIAMAVLDPKSGVTQNELVRQMVREFRPPRWAGQIVVEADAGFAATKTVAMLSELEYGLVFAAARTRKLTNWQSSGDRPRPRQSKTQAIGRVALLSFISSACSP